MIKNVLLLLILSIVSVFINAQTNTDTPNLSFEDGSLNKWKIYTGKYYYDNVSTSATYGSYAYSWTPVTTTDRINIISNNSSTYDPVIACDLLTNPDNNSVVRIGKPTICESWNGSYYETSAGAEKIEYTFKVTKNTTLLSYKLAAVLHVPTNDNHLGDQRPSFTMDITIVDSLGVSYSIPCSSYSSKAASGGGLVTNSNCLSSTAGKYRLEYVYQPWISGNVDLSAQLGKTVTITVKTHDCLLNTGSYTDVAGNHSAYGYFWAETKKIELTSFSCENENTTIVAPLGFTSYNWTRSDGQPMTISNPAQPNILVVDKSLYHEGTIYSCAMDNANSLCGAITASTIVTPVKLDPNFSSVAIDAGKIKFTSTSTAVGDSISSYYWDFGDGGSSFEQNPTHIYYEFKPFNVKLTITSVKGCSKTVSNNVSPTKELIAEIFPPANLVYNGQTKDFTDIVNIAGLQRNIDYYIRYTNRAGTPFYSSYSAPTTVGDYTATFELSYLSLLKYFITSVPTKDFTITKAPIVVTISNVLKTYGEKITLLRDAFTQDMNPLYAGDKIYELELKSGGQNDTSRVGTYTIKADSAIGLGVKNYDIQFVNGTLTVQPKQLNISAINTFKTYGSQILVTGNEFFVTPGSLVKEDSIKSVTLQCNGFDSLAIVGSYPITASAATGYRLSNYTINYKPAILVINKKKVTVSAQKLNKVYGTIYSFNGNEYSTDNTQFVANDSIAQLQFTSQATPLKAQVGEYGLSIIGVSGYRLENYDINLVNNTFTVSPMPITIIAKKMEKEYSDLFSFSGNEFITDKPLIIGDTVSFVLLKSSGSIETAPVNSYNILASLAYGVGTLNYDFTYIPGVLNVVKKKMNASLNPPSYLVYNAKPKDFTATMSVSGLLQNSDYYIHYTNQPGTPLYNDSITAPSTVGDYTATFKLSVSSKSKYELTSTPVQDFIITKAPLTITS
ncbi:MAG: MBG domain-containing protein, partial [Paludibacter sp.]|nr:MBG domain-containing protein [Paludibacter sp.]